MLETSFELETSGLRAEVKKEALKEGITIGEKRGKLETASQLVSAGVPLNLIIKATKLTEQQILEYGKKFSKS